MNLTVNSPLCTGLAVIYSVVGAAAFLVMPLLVGAAAEEFQLNESQLGYLAATAMGGSAISAVLAIFWVRRFNWRLIMTMAMLILGSAYGFALSAADYAALLPAIFVASLGGGTAYSLALTILSDNDNPDRVFGYSIAAQVSFQVIGLMFVPGLIENGGIDVLFLLFIALALLGLTGSWLIPVKGKNKDINNVMQIFSQKNVMFALAGCLFFFFNVGCFWTFIERMGNAAGYTGQTIGNSLAAGVSVGILGSLCASWFGSRYGRLRPLLFSALGTVVSAILLSVSDALSIYVIAVALYNFVWNYSLVYQYAVVAAADDSGRGVAMAPAFHALGGALGPALAGILVSTDSFIAVHILVSVSVMISFLFFIPACRGEN